MGTLNAMPFTPRNFSWRRLALAAILVLVPHTKLPGVEFVYPFRLVDLFIIVAAVLYLRFGSRSQESSTAGRAMAVCYLFSIASMLWGMYYLSSLNLAKIIQNGVSVDYIQFAIRKLVLMAVCFLGFQWLIRTRSLPNEVLLKYWHRGLLIAVALHTLSYILSSDYLMQRAGVFVEGNHGGSYYLLSFFLMWWSVKLRMRFGRSGMLLSFVGITLTQSSAALILLIPLGALACMLQTNTMERKTKRFMPIAIGALAATLTLSVFGTEIFSKLTDQDINSLSFSRYDRIASVASGINMFTANPVFGVGIQGYAFALPRFADSFIESFFDWNSRRIANNIYIELLAEQGLIGLAAMSLVLLRIATPTFRQLRKNAILCAGILSVLLGWLAFPSYTISFQWIGLALMHRLAVQGQVSATDRIFPAASIYKNLTKPSQ